MECGIIYQQTWELTTFLSVDRCHVYCMAAPTVFIFPDNFLAFGRELRRKFAVISRESRRTVVFHLEGLFLAAKTVLKIQQNGGPHSW